MMTAKRILFLLRQPPYVTSHAVEALEALLVAGVFDQRLTVLFRDDGVWQLLAGQESGALGIRNVGKVVQALAEYDITNVYVCARSLERRGLALEDLAVPAKSVDSTGQSQLLADQDAVVND